MRTVRFGEGQVGVSHPATLYNNIYSVCKDRKTYAPDLLVQGHMFF